MIGTYNKYQIIRILRLSIIVGILLTTILWITQSFKVFELIINNGISIKDFLKLLIYLFPTIFYNIIPFTALITAVLEVQRMIRDQELLILQSNSYNYLQIAKPFITSSIIITCIALIFSSYIMPKFYREFKLLQFSLQHSYASFLLEKGMFSSKINGLTFYIANKNKDGLMYGILTNDARSPNKDITITAKFGKLAVNENKIALILENGTRQEYNRINNKFTLMTFNKYVFNLDLSNFFNQKYIDNPNEKFITKVFKAALKEKDKRYIINLQNRVLWPLFCIILGVLPIALSVRSFYYRYINRYNNIKILLYTTFFVAFFIIAENLSIKNLSWSYLMYAATIIPMFFVFYTLRCNKQYK